MRDRKVLFENCGGVRPDLRDTMRDAPGAGCGLVRAGLTESIFLMCATIALAIGKDPG